MRDNLSDYITEKLQQSAEPEVVLSGRQWIDSLYNYTKNGEDYDFTLLQFKSTGCTLCKEMEPEMELIKKDPGQKVKVAVLNVMNSNSQNVMKYFGVSAVPVILILNKEGNEAFRKYGFISAEELRLHFN